MKTKTNPSFRDKNETCTERNRTKMARISRVAQPSTKYNIYTPNKDRSTQTNDLLLNFSHIVEGFNEP